jgi:uncharacterized protein (TIRG00374 family)
MVPRGKIDIHSAQTTMKRKWILGVLTVAFLWLVVSRYSQIEALQRTLAGGRWEWVLAAALIQTIYYIIFSASYQAALAAVDVHSRLRDLLPLTFSAIFINVAAPSGGAAGAALIVDDLRRRGQPPARAAVGIFLQLVADFTAVTIILVPGLYYLFTRHDLQTYEIIAAIILFAATFGLSGALLLGLWRPTLLHRLLHRLQRLLNGLFGLLRISAQLAEGWAERNAAEFSAAAAAAAAHPLRVARAVGVALAAHIINIVSLYTLFLAFNQPIRAGALIAGYAMGMLFLIVSVTPMGIGVVEGVMTLVFTSLYIPTEAAAAVTLSFRGLGFWLPLGLGFLLLRRAIRPPLEA